MSLPSTNFPDEALYVVEGETKAILWTAGLLFVTSFGIGAKPSYAPIKDLIFSIL